MDSDKAPAIPPLIPGTTVYATWIENIPDLLKAAKCGAIFITPDPRKRLPFTGRANCTQVGHPLFGTQPPKETDERYNYLCDTWAAADSRAAALVRGALDESTRQAARMT